MRPNPFYLFNKSLFTYEKRAFLDSRIFAHFGTLSLNISLCDSRIYKHLDGNCKEAFCKTTGCLQ